MADENAQQGGVSCFVFTVTSHLVADSTFRFKDYYDGIKANLSGNRDAFWIEGSELGRYDSAKQQFVQQGDIIDLSGQAKPCAWNQSTSTCG